MLPAVRSPCVHAPFVCPQNHIGTFALKSFLVGVLMNFPSAGRLAAIDFGSKRIGIAICDPGRSLVSPYDVWPRQPSEREAAVFRKLLKEEGVVGWVLGWPLHCDGKVSDKAREVRAFAVWLEQETGLPIRLFDERFTTAAAQRKLRAVHNRRGVKARIDAVAAQILLEAFIEACAGRIDPPGICPHDASARQPGESISDEPTS